MDHMLAHRAGNDRGRKIMDVRGILQDEPRPCCAQALFLERADNYLQSKCGCPEDSRTSADDKGNDSRRRRILVDGLRTTLRAIVVRCRHNAGCCGYCPTADKVESFERAYRAYLKRSPV